MRSLLIATALLVACGDNAAKPGADAIAVDPSQVALVAGDSTMATASFTKKGVPIDSDVEWSTSDPSIAKVTGSGATVTITAVAAGTATVTASGNDLSADVAVTVSPAVLRRIEIVPAVPSLAAGTDLPVKVMAIYSDRSIDVTTDAVWSSAPSGIASVSGTTLHGIKKGETTITATYMSLFSSTHVFVTAAVLSSIEVTPATPMVTVGTTQQFTATGHFSDGTTKDITTTATWSSSDTGVATIAAGGLATTVAIGPTTITAKSGMISGSTAMTVIASVLQSIDVTPANPDVELPDDKPFTATGHFSDGSSSDITANVTWDSSDATVATVSTSGVASTLKVGMSTIRATSGSVMGSSGINVVLAAVGSWVAAPGYTGELPCIDGVKFSMASDSVYVCTATNGVIKGVVSAIDTSIVFATANAGITNLAGLSIATHSANATTVMYMGQPAAGTANWFRSMDAAVSWTPSTLTDSTGAPRALYAGRFQPMIGNLLGSWDPTGAVVLAGMSTFTAHAIASATGEVRAITGSAANNLYVGVLGETPSGGAATGGVFRSTTSAATWVESDTGIVEKDLVTSLVIDPTDANTLYAGVRGGGQIYKTADGGATWTANASGLHPRAKVAALFISPLDHTVVWAATDLGLYQSTNSGATWTLAGFKGRAVRAIAQSGVAAALVLAGVDDSVGLYRAM